MELAVLAAGIAGGRQVRQQRRVECAAAEPRIQLVGIDATQVRLQARIDHLAGQGAGITAEQRGLDLPAVAFAQGLPPCAHVGQVEIAERNRPQPRPARTGRGERIGECGLVNRVVAMRRNHRLDQRQSDRAGLCMQYVAPDAVHRHALILASDGGQQSHHLHIVALAQGVQGPCGVLAAAPCEQEVGHAAIVAGMRAKEAGDATRVRPRSRPAIPSRCRQAGAGVA